MTSIYREVEVEFDLADIDTEDLINELKTRSEYRWNTDNDDRIFKIYELRKLGKSFDAELDELIYEVIGRM